MSILALDLGEKKIGVAVSYSNVSAQGLKTINANDLEMLAQMVDNLKVSRIICGAPLKNNRPSRQSKRIAHQAKEIKNFLLKKNLKPSFNWVDETLSTAEAKQITGTQDPDKIHLLSAQIILDQYLSGLNSNEKK